MADTRQKCRECGGKGIGPWGETCLVCGGQGRAPFREWGKEDDEDNPVLDAEPFDPILQRRAMAGLERPNRDCKCPDRGQLPKDKP